MRPENLISHFGSIANAARALQVSAPTIHGWIDAKEIPIGRQCQIEILTDGALRADRDEHGRPVKRDARAAPEAAA